MPIDPVSPQALALYDLLPTGMCIVSADGRFLATNEPYCKLLGYTRDELLALTVADITVEADTPRDELARRDLLEGRLAVHRAEKRYRRKDGQVVWVRIHAQKGLPLACGGDCAVATVSRIDDLKVEQQARREEQVGRLRAERELDDSQAQLVALFEQTAVGVAETDLQGRLLAVNDRYCELMQRTREQLLGVRMHDLAHPEDVPRNLPLFEKLAHDGDQFELEKRYLRPDGSQIWANVAVSLVKPRDGSQARSMLAMVFDITARKKMEEALRAADRKKDEFLAMLAHELRNPLAPIAAAASLLRSGRLEGARVGQVSDIIARQVRHMTGLVDDLLDVSRVTRGVAVLELADVDLRRTIEEALEQVRPLVESRGHRLEVQLAERPAIVRGDFERLVQVVVNILNNAAKYTPQNGTIRLALRTEAREAVLSIADTGIGMTPEMLDNAFELFTQAARSSDRSQGGLGIGLALVRKLVELHGGSVRALSAGEDQGSEFIVRLPLAMQAHDADATPGSVGPATGERRLRTLVVDDNVDAADMLGLLLETIGHSVRVEHDPFAALEAAIADKPDVCILDIGLPGMDGNELARRIREQPGMRNVFLIAVTGYGQEQDKRAAAAAGFDHHFVKPVAIEQLAAVLETVQRGTQVELNL